MKQFSSIIYLSLLLIFALDVNAATVTVAGESADVGTEVLITVSGTDLPAQITAFQGTLEWDPALLKLKSAESTLLSTMAFNTSNPSKVAFVWGNVAVATSGGANTLFSMTFEVLAEGRADIVFANDPTTALMSDGAFAFVSLDLEGGFVEGNDPLPVELSAFGATATEDAVRLDWTTASEVDFEGFEVERSLDGVDFNGIAWLDARGSEIQGAGYSFLDEEVGFNQTYYYRLKMWDWDGTYEYSYVVNAKTAQGDLPVIQVFPNPAKDRTAVVFDNFSNLENEPVITTVHDISGRIMERVEHTMQNGINRIELDITGLATGLYTVSIEHAGYYRTEKLVIK